MTEEIKQKLQAELKELDYELSVTLPREIKKAVEYGDLRENAEYKAALERQEILTSRTRQLRERLHEIESIDLSKIPTDKAAYGSILELYDPDKDEVVTYRLVTPEESDPLGGFISTVSPIGRSLMGKEEGDEVRVITPAGMRTFEIRSLKTLHDQKT
ncbi:MAG TPA: transcription elongation factor GreA [Pyrinomonadaceae bacterium]|nr:transcription elongation factor GreA [Pyrinomonadaceae bacterium]